jgi:hypothetical protein
MTKVITIIFSVLTLTTFGQVDNGKTFRKVDYPTTKYSIKADTFYFAGFEIELIQAKLRDYKTYDSTAAYCRIWLTIKKGNTTVDKLFINDCEALGGCSGLYASNEQTRKDYFILSKFGDYDGRILIIDTSGKIKSFIGGHYYLSTDNKYLFSPFSSDLSGLTVYDLSKNQVLFTSDTISTYLADFYYFDNKYFAIVSDDVKKANQTDIATYDFKTNKLVVSTVEDSYIAKAKRLKGYNIFTYAPCGCGQTKK